MLFRRLRTLVMDIRPTFENLEARAVVIGPEGHRLDIESVYVALGSREVYIMLDHDSTMRMFEALRPLLVAAGQNDVSSAVPAPPHPATG